MPLAAARSASQPRITRTGMHRTAEHTEARVISAEAWRVAAARFGDCSVAYSMTSFEASPGRLCLTLALAQVTEGQQLSSEMGLEIVRHHVISAISHQHARLPSEPFYQPAVSK